MRQTLWYVASGCVHWVKIWTTPPHRQTASSTFFLQLHNKRNWKIYSICEDKICKQTNKQLIILFFSFDMADKMRMAVVSPYPASCGEEVKK